MPLTLDEILQCEDRLQAEIAERECLLAAVKVMKGYAERGKSLKGLELGALGKALLAPEATPTLMLQATADNPAQQTPPSPAPALPQPKPYIHADLEQLCRRNHGRDTMIVCWATQRMTEDFTLNDIANLLKREGLRMRNEKISVVLTRMKNRREISEVRRGAGRTAAVFAKPVVRPDQSNALAGEISGIESTPQAAAA